MNGYLLKLDSPRLFDAGLEVDQFSMILELISNMEILVQAWLVGVLLKIQVRTLYQNFV